MDRRKFINRGGSFFVLGIAAAGSLGFVSEFTEVKPYTVLAVRCNGCGHCIASCRQKVITLTSGKAVINAEKCTGCGDCVRSCRRQAIVKSS